MRLVCDKAKKIAAHLLEVAEGDLEWEIDHARSAALALGAARIDLERLHDRLVVRGSFVGAPSRRYFGSSTCSMRLRWRASPLH